MDRDTATALRELATTGRLSDATQDAVNEALGQHVDDDTGLIVPDDVGPGEDPES